MLVAKQTPIKQETSLPMYTNQRASQAWIQVLSAAPLVSKPPEYSPQKTSAGVR